MGSVAALTATTGLVSTLIAWMQKGRVDFHIILTCGILAMLWLLYKSQRKNDQAIGARLDELVRRQERAAGTNDRIKQRWAVQDSGIPQRDVMST